MPSRRIKDEFTVSDPDWQMKNPNPAWANFDGDGQRRCPICCKLIRGYSVVHRFGLLFDSWKCSREYLKQQRGGNWNVITAYERERKRG